MLGLNNADHNLATTDAQQTYSKTPNELHAEPLELGLSFSLNSSQRHLKSNSCSLNSLLAETMAKRAGQSIGLILIAAHFSA